jgi:hypothetical protein
MMLHPIIRAVQPPKVVVISLRFLPSPSHRHLDSVSLSRRRQSSPSVRRMVRGGLMSMSHLAIPARDRNSPVKIRIRPNIG